VAGGEGATRHPADARYPIEARHPIQDDGLTNASDLTGGGDHDGREHHVGDPSGGDPSGDEDVRSPYSPRRRRDLFTQREDDGDGGDLELPDLAGAGRSLTSSRRRKAGTKAGARAGRGRARAGGERAGGESARPRGAGAATGEWSAEETARQVCLELLSRGPRTRTQLASALRKRGVADEVAESVFGRFAEVGLIDDAAFAHAWVESRHHSRGLSGSMLAAELHQRGVDAEEVQAAVDTLGPDAEVETARRLVAKRIAGTRGRPLPNRARQLVGLLARKGYPASLAYRVVREALEQDIVNSDTPRVDRLRLEQIDLAAAEDSAIDADPLGGLEPDT
jgi:regulatory protein